MLALRWSNVDFNSGTVHVGQTLSRVKGMGLIFGPTKSDYSTRAIFIPPVVLDAVVAHYASQEAERLAAGDLWVDTGLVFTTRTGRPIEPSGLNRLFATLCRRAGIAPERVHNLRHTAGTILRAYGGADLFDVKEILGHSTIAITDQYYGHRVSATQRALADRISDLYEVAEPVAVNRAVIPPRSVSPAETGGLRKRP